MNCVIRNRANYGYAFVNFTNAIAASRFCESFHKYEWKVSVNKKICEISCAVIQVRIKSFLSFFFHLASVSFLLFLKNFLVDIALYLHISRVKKLSRTSSRTPCSIVTAMVICRWFFHPHAMVWFALNLLLLVGVVHRQ